MSIKIKKVSSLTKINPSQTTKNDNFYFVRQNAVNYESYNTSLADTFLSTSNIEEARFCSNTIIITKNEINFKDVLDINGNLKINGNNYSNNFSTTLIASTNGFTNNVHSQVISFLSNYFYINETDVFTNDNTFSLNESEIKIKNGVNIDSGLNRVRNVNNPTQNLDALNLLYFNENTFKMTGAVITFPTNREPQGFLRTNNQIVSRTTYGNLWLFANSSGYLAASEASKANTQFGPGDGSTTFSLPNINCCSTTYSGNNNIMIIFDRSGSMAFDNKLVLAKQAVSNLLNIYEGYGQTKSLVIEFNADANLLISWNDIDDVITSINTLKAVGNTNYDAAIDIAKSSWNNLGKLEGSVSNVCYFISDGEPTRPSGGLGLDASQEQSWITFLRTNKINCFAIGITSAATLTYLNPVAYNGAVSIDRNGTIVSDPNNLSDSLISTINPSIISLPSFIKT